MPQEDSIIVPPNVFILFPLHKTFDALLQFNNSLEAITSMSHHFEISRSSPLPNIVTNFILGWVPTHGKFFSTHIWDLTLAVTLCSAPLSPTPSQGFSPLLTLLLDPDHVPKSATHTDLPDKGFTSFQYILYFIKGCKWLLILVFHPTYSSSTITYQGLSLLEDHMKDSNLAARWKDPTIQTTPVSYQFLELVHNLFATLSATECNIPQSSLLLTMIYVPATNPSFLISPTIQ